MRPKCGLEIQPHEVKYVTGFGLPNGPGSVWNMKSQRPSGATLVRQVRRRLHHAPRVGRGANATAFAGKGDEVVVSAIAATGAGKAVGEDAAFQIFAKRLANKNLCGLVVALTVELASVSAFMPGLKVLGNRLVQQREFRVARVVEFGRGFEVGRG